MLPSELEELLDELLPDPEPLDPVDPESLESEEEEDLQ